MSALVEAIKQDLEVARKTAAEGWAAFDAQRKEHGDDKLAKDADLFEEANRLFKTYGEAAEQCKYLEGKLFDALAMDGGVAPEGIAKAGAGADAAGRKDAVHELLGMSFGEKAADALIESESYKAFIANPASKSNTLQMGQMFAADEVIDRKTFKTLVTGLSSTSGGAFVVNDRLSGVIEEFARVDNVIARLVGSGTTDSDTIEWVALTGVTNNAAETLEAVDADKAAGAAPSSAPESALALAIRTTTVEEIKHFIPATKRSLADAGQLRTIIDSELLRGLQDRLDGQLLNGNGTTPNLRGILNTSGIQTQAKGADSIVDAIHKAFTKLVLAGFNNLTALLHPNDWQDIRLDKDANGNYHYGPPSTVGATTVWGRPVELSARITEGTGLTGDFGRAATLWFREGPSITATDSHSDWFTKGIVAILASMRAGFAVRQPLGFCTVTGI